MIEVERLSSGCVSISPARASAEGLVIHGYGGNLDELMGLGVTVAEAAQVRLIIFNLPGHGPDPVTSLTLKSASAAVGTALAKLDNPSFVIGHSLGARLGLAAGLDRAILISMPGPIRFEGNRRDLLNTLRARRVRESAPFAGLKEILEKPVDPARETLMMTAAQDIESVTVQARAWRDLCDKQVRIEGSNHLDIVSAALAHQEIAGWLANRRL